MDEEHCYRAVSSRDGRFDGAFVTAVTTTKIYCRPSCPAITPKRNHVRFYATPAAAQEAGFRACKRCRPDAAPGSPDWDLRADLVARTVRLIGDGVVEREGVSGLAARLDYSTRQLHRLVFAELGTGPLRLALAHRVQSARALLETTDLAVTDVAWAAGFGSIRQFNDRIREVYGLTPSELRRRSLSDSPNRAGLTPGSIPVRLAYRPPLDLDALLGFLGQRAIPGVESYDGTTYSRVLRLPHGLGTVSVAVDPRTASRVTTGKARKPEFIDCVLKLDDVRDFATAVARVRRLFDLDADPTAVKLALESDPLLRPLVRRNPGLRVPGAVDGPELAMRAVLGQQVSVAGARALAGRLTDELGDEIAVPDGGLRRAFPAPEKLSRLDPSRLPLPAGRARAMISVASALADGRVSIDPGADRDETERALMATPGIGPWTASYIRMRALGDPDVFLGSDLGIKKALGAASVPADPETWKPWRSYATVQLWSTLETGSPTSQRNASKPQRSKPDKETTSR
jgi:AraC family transcriptional regulator, regulatory protein of adaptative response / DNA-3-methyladenine glycosylase II